jgi:hypothetical protein
MRGPRKIPSRKNWKTSGAGQVGSRYSAAAETARFSAVADADGGADKLVAKLPDGRKAGGVRRAPAPEA